MKSYIKDVSLTLIIWCSFLYMMMTNGIFLHFGTLQQSLTINFALIVAFIISETIWFLWGKLKEDSAR
jgi:hypothetical protein